jgi:cell wall-associated NlpC family hydrolase
MRSGILIGQLFLFSCLAGCDGILPNGKKEVKANLLVKDSLQAKKNSTITNSIAVDTTAGDTKTAPVPLAPAENIDTKGVAPQQIVQFAETLIGTPYVYASTDPNVGFDCSGFITYVFNHFGIRVPRSSVDFTNAGNEVPSANAKSGDIILFSGTNPAERHVGHMGIVVSNTDTLRFIHSTSGKAMGVTISPLSSYYLSRFVKVIRVFQENN